jgi:hypothetical protein
MLAYIVTQNLSSFDCAFDDRCFEATRPQRMHQSTVGMKGFERVILGQQDADVEGAAALE